MDSKKHGAAVNSRASVGRKVGGRFSAFGGMLRGRILARVPVVPLPGVESLKV